MEPSHVRLYWYVYCRRGLLSLTLDRVFVKAITTIRALSSRSSYGTLPRPPAENRIKLYGLYKQAVEGDVENVMPRPQGRTLEDEGAKKKWDAWRREQGLTRTEAKRQYIAYLIETMRTYASGTLEARELLAELEYLWDQIKDLQFSDEDDYAAPRLPDRYLTATPTFLVANMQLLHYRNNLQKIYSHSRRSTMSVNDFVEQQQRQLQSHGAGGSVYLMQLAPVRAVPRAAAPTAAAAAVGAAAPASDLRQWQGDVNTIINKLSREFGPSRRYRRDSDAIAPNDVDTQFDRLWRRAAHVARIVGARLLRYLKAFSLSLLAILFVTWVLKRNVKVKRSIVRQPLAPGRDTTELVVNMVVNMDENKWFVRWLGLVNAFVGFV